MNFMGGGKEVNFVRYFYLTFYKKLNQYEESVAIR